MNEQKIKTDDKVDKVFWFEYHCLESPTSGDVEVWYHSHQKVKVLSIVELGNGDSKEKRLEIGESRVYSVQFDDGLIWDVFEDELMENPNESCRPDPPKKRG